MLWTASAEFSSMISRTFRSSSSRRFLYILTEPSLTAARLLLYGYVVSRLAHFAAYFTAQTHDVRATLWTIGSLILIYLTCWPLLVALGI